MKLIEKLQTGDVVYCACSNAQLCYHVGIVCEINGVKKIFHNSPKIKNKFGGSVCSETFQEYLKDSHVYRVVRTNTSKERILNVSKKYKSEVWNELFFNCEDYVLECVEGHRRSNQRDAFKIIALGITIILLI